MEPEKELEQPKSEPPKDYMEDRNAAHLIFWSKGFIILLAIGSVFFIGRSGCDSYRKNQEQAEIERQNSENARLAREAEESAQKARDLQAKLDAKEEAERQAKLQAEMRQASPPPATTEEPAETNPSPGSPESTAESTPIPDSAEPTPDTGDQIRYPQVRDREITASEADGMTFSQLRYAINETYARYGLRFRTPSIQAEFDKKSWYRGVPGKSIPQCESEMSKLERNNLKVLGMAKAKKPAEP